MEMMDVPQPKISQANEVLIKLKTIGVCGSDIHYYTTGKIGSQVVEYPFTVGHECAGVVEAVGEGVTRVKSGDRIAVDPAMSCWECDQCKVGRHHTCRDLRFLGCPGQAEGCLSEYIVMPEKSCFPIGENATFDDAAISEPLSIGVYAVKKSIDLTGATIAILGSGPIGLSVMLSAMAKGAKKIYITDKIDARLEAAKKAGAYWTGNPDKENIVETISKHEPLLLDAVFECCGQQEAVDQAVELLKPGGKLLIVGIPEFDRWSFTADDTRRKEICIQNIRRQVDCVEASLQLMETRQINISFMVTHRFDFKDSNKAFDLVASYKDGVIKAMIDFD